MDQTGNDTDTAWYYKGKVDYVDNWYLMGSPWPVLGLWLVYLAFVLKLGPTFMSKRPAFQLKNPMVLYNILQVALSCYIFYYGSNVMYQWGLVSPYCAIEGEKSREYVIRGVYIYLLAKVSELLDTVFFVLRKKMNQVTFLHVYHHSLMMLSTWFALKYNPTDAVVFLGTLNSLVHVVMYAYYGLSAFPSLTKFLWWKKYITSFQLIQFGLITIQVTIGTFVSNCNTSYIILCIIYFNLALMIYLFRDFYIKSYMNKVPVNVKRQKETVVEDTKGGKGKMAAMIKNDQRVAESMKIKGV